MLSIKQVFSLVRRGNPIYNLTTKLKRSFTYEWVDFDIHRKKLLFYIRVVITLLSIQTTNRHNDKVE